MEKIFNILLFVSLFCCTSCLKENKFSSSTEYDISLQKDTLEFDTVFTATGSTTKSVNIYNTNNYGLHLEARLAGGESSPFRMNIDGESGVVVQNLSIWANDSITAFVSVTIDPQDKDMPFFVQDSILFTLESGLCTKLHLTAYGQDAVILRSVTFREDTVMTSKRPYIIFDSLCVDSNAVLTIEKGAGLYFHKNAFLKVNGTVHALGTADSMIQFRSDRLDNIFSYLKYDELSGEWSGIRIDTASFGNIFRSCNIHGAETGIYATEDSASQNNGIKIYAKGTVIHSNSDYCVFLNNSSAVFENCQITNSGKYCYFADGASQDITYCTIANFYPFGQNNGAVLLNNADCSIQGSIITGRSSNELVFSNTDSVGHKQFVEKSLVMARDSANAMFYECRFENVKDETSQENNFKMIDYQKYSSDFELAPSSKAVSMVDTLYNPVDLKGRPRNIEFSCAGCYEYIPVREE